MYYEFISKKKGEIKQLINLCLNAGISFECSNGDTIQVFVYDDLLKDGYYNSILNFIQPAS